ncbi:MAG: hypothetical protein FWH01_06430 [Oscillospiraceae bacterium]|nr:hypothetical protein [Oscillospiraceae bacterium]
MNGYFHRVQAATATRFWINNVTREETRLAIEAGARGCTQNPSFPFKMLTTQDPNEREYVYGLLDPIIVRQPDDNAAQMELQRELVKNIARAFMPIYESSGGRDGYVSIQGDPFREDAETIIKSAEFNCVAPNIMAKIPVTPDGLEAIKALAPKGIPINATEVMSVRQALDVCEAYAGATAGMKAPPVIYYSHISGILDEYLQNNVKEQNIDISKDALWHAGIAAAKKTHRLTRERGYGAVGFIGGGARGLHHFTEMVGADAVVTINWKGTAEELINGGTIVTQRFFMPTPESVIDELCEKLPDFRKAYMLDAISPNEYEHFGPVALFRTMFEDAWRDANTLIAERRAQVSA